MADNTDYDESLKYKPGAVNTFQQQSENLQKQVGQDTGLQTGQQKVQQETSNAQQKAGEIATNLGEGQRQISQGNKDPLQIDYSQLQKQPQFAQNYVDPNAPTTQLDAPKLTDVPVDLSTVDTKGFTSDVPNSTLDNLNNSNYATEFEKYVGDPSDSQLTSVKNQLQNKVTEAVNRINEQYDKGLITLQEQQQAKQQAIQNYIKSLNDTLATFNKTTGDLSNLGKENKLETQSAALNSTLANANSSAEALNALNPNAAANTRLSALTQQAQQAGLQEARGVGAEQTALSKEAQNMLNRGLTEQQKGLSDANKNILDKQEKLNNDLNASNDAKKKELKDLHDNMISTLNQKGKEATEHASDLLQKSGVSKDNIDHAAQAWSNMMSKNIDSLNSDVDVRDMWQNIEKIYRIATTGQDKAFSDKISGYLMPLLDKLKQRAERSNGGGGGSGYGPYLKGQIGPAIVNPVWTGHKIAADVGSDVGNQVKNALHW